MKTVKISRFKPSGKWYDDFDFPVKDEWAAHDIIAVVSIRYSEDTSKGWSFLINEGENFSVNHLIRQ